MLSRKDSLIKALTYRLFTSVLTFLLVLIFTGKLDVAGAFTLVDFTLRTLMYYVHERVFLAWWKTYRKGKSSDTVNSPEDVPEQTLSNFPTLMCRCGDRPASDCDEEWGPECDLGNNPEFARKAPDGLQFSGPVEVSTKHGPWKEATLHKGERYCARCLTMECFWDKRPCDPHLVAKENLPGKLK